MRFHFSLRTLLLLVTFFGVAFGAAMNHVLKVKQQTRQHLAAVVQLRELGAQGLYSLNSLEPPEVPSTSVWIARKLIDPECFPQRRFYYCQKQLTEAEAIRALELFRDIYGLSQFTLRIESINGEIRDGLTHFSEVSIDLDIEGGDGVAGVDQREPPVAPKVFKHHLSKQPVH